VPIFIDVVEIFGFLVRSAFLDKVSFYLLYMWGEMVHEQNWLDSCCHVPFFQTGNGRLEGLSGIGFAICLLLVRRNFYCSNLNAYGKAFFKLLMV
jgi:hypothetical protein